MDHRTFSVNGCVSDGFEAFRNHAGTLTLGAFVFSILVILPGLLLSYLGFIIPVLRFLIFIFFIFVLPPLFGGLFILMLKAARHQRPDVSDILAGFQAYWKFMGVFWLYQAINYILGLIVSVPMNAKLRAIAGAIANNPDSVNNLFSAFWPPDAAMILYVALMVMSIIIMFRWIFIYFVAADEPQRPLLDIFRRSAEITAGYRLKLFLLLFLFLLCMFLGGFVIVLGTIMLRAALLCFLGTMGWLIIIGNFTACSLASAYVQLTGTGTGTATAAIGDEATTSPYEYVKPPPPLTWLVPPPEAANPPAPPDIDRSPASAPLGRVADGQTETPAWSGPQAPPEQSAPPSSLEPAAAVPINLNPHFVPAMEPLRLDQTVVKFALRDQTSILNCGAPIVHLALSPDGALIAAACQDGTVKIWDRYRKSLLSGFTVGLLPADSLAVSPDKQTILAGCRDLQQQSGCPVKAYAAPAGEKKRYDLHTLPVTALAFSPRGEKAASISWDRSVKVWELDTGNVLLDGKHPQRGLAAVFSFDGTRIVSASQDGTLIVWDIPEASAVATRSIKIQGPCQAAISAGGEWAVLKEESGRAVLIDVRTGKIDAEWTTQGTPYALHASAEGAVVAWEAWGNTLRPRHAQGQRYLPDPTNGHSHNGDVRCIAVSIDGMCVVSGGADGLVGIWEAI